MYCNEEETDDRVASVTITRKCICLSKFYPIKKCFRKRRPYVVNVVFLSKVEMEGFSFQSKKWLESFLTRVFFSNLVTKWQWCHSVMCLVDLRSGLESLLCLFDLFRIGDTEERQYYLLLYHLNFFLYSLWSWKLTQCK